MKRPNVRKDQQTRTLLAAAAMGMLGTHQHTHTPTHTCRWLTWTKARRQRVMPYLLCISSTGPKQRQWVATLPPKPFSWGFHLHCFVWNTDQLQTPNPKVQVQTTWGRFHRKAPRRCSNWASNPGATVPLTRGLGWRLVSLIVVSPRPTFFFSSSSAPDQICHRGRRQRNITLRRAFLDIFAVPD